MRNLATGAKPGVVLLASGRWAQAAYDPPGLFLEYHQRMGPGGRGEIELRRAPLSPTVLFCPGGPWQRAGDRTPYDDGGPTPSQLVPRAEPGGTRWYLGDEPMHAGEPLEVYLPLARDERLWNSGLTAQVAKGGGNTAGGWPCASARPRLGT